MSNNSKGSLVVVGTGIKGASQMTATARAQIERADIVFAAQACTVAMHYIQSLNTNVVNLGELYQEGKSRVLTYRQMVEQIVEAVVQGKQVCGAFYGHPGVFVYAGHQAIKQLKKLDYKASMEPGISAEDCLLADLGLDPGNHGLQAMEVSQFLFYQHQINPHNLVILWQFGLTGDFDFNTLEVERYQKGLRILKDELLAFYPPTHQVTLYEASTLAIEKPRIEHMPLNDIEQSNPTVLSTLVIPSLGYPQYDTRVMAKFGISVEQFEQNLDGLLED